MKENKKEISKLEQTIGALDSVISDKGVNLTTLQLEYTILEQKKKLLETEIGSRLDLSPESVQELSINESIISSQNANVALKEVAKAHAPVKNIRVLYYQREMEKDQILAALEPLGYSIEGRNSTSKMRELKSNAIWFGSGVHVEDIKIIALALIASGIEIKSIRPFKDSANDPSYKQNIVELGSDINLVKQPPLSSEEIKSASSFSR